MMALMADDDPTAPTSAERTERTGLLLVELRTLADRLHRVADALDDELGIDTNDDGARQTRSDE
jgi:hypothetical protein